MKNNRGKSLTREEIAYRKARCMYLLCLFSWAALLIGILLFMTPRSNAIDVPQATETEAPTPIIEEEAVSAEYDPVRDDIPLDAELQRLLYQATVETGVRYELALAVIWQETDFRNIVGDGGDSVGYMQVQPRWHSERMERLGVTDLTDPYSNFLVGCDFLAELYGKYDLNEALTAYNSGTPGDSQYATDVLNYMNILTEDF